MQIEKQKLGFTMAEILLSLTIIGVVAAITLPSLTGNINERTWNTQKKALFARMSQAIALMPALNGYDAADDKTAEKFITSGLAKVLKMNNVCGNNNLFDCGFHSKLTNGNNIKVDLPKEIKDINPSMITTTNFVSIRNTKAAAFETANGESILTFYNPNCTPQNVLVDGHDDAGVSHGYVMKQYVCANFMFDLNGKKGPNTVGKDIGVMLVAYSTDSKVVMPMDPKALSGKKEQAEAAKACGGIENNEYRLPNIEEVLALYYNREILGDKWPEGQIWSGTSIDSSDAWSMMKWGGIKYKTGKGAKLGITCVKRN